MQNCAKKIVISTDFLSVNTLYTKKNKLVEEILNNLRKAEVLYITKKNVNYYFIRRSYDGGVMYSINDNTKTLPFNTINAAIEAQNNGIEINKLWYHNFNPIESKTRTSNLQVLIKLIERMKSF